MRIELLKLPFAPVGSVWLVSFSILYADRIIEINIGSRQAPEVIPSFSILYADRIIEMVMDAEDGCKAFEFQYPLCGSNY